MVSTMKAAASYANGPVTSQITRLAKGEIDVQMTTRRSPRRPEAAAIRSPSRLLDSRRPRSRFPDSSCAKSLPSDLQASSMKFSAHQSVPSLPSAATRRARSAQRRLLSECQALPLCRATWSLESRASTSRSAAVRAAGSLSAERVLMNTHEERPSESSEGSPRRVKVESRMRCIEILRKAAVDSG